MQFGISPFGIWRPKNPPQIKGFDAYKEIYVDSRLWLVDGWVDYLAPQLYWPITKPEQSFPALLNWWRAQNVKGRHLWPVLADSSVGGKFSDDEIPRQIQIVRQQSDAAKSISPPHRLGKPRAQRLRPRRLCAARTRADDAVDPAPAPLKPKLAVDAVTNSAHVRWKNPGNEPVRWWVLQSRADAAWTTEIFPASRDGFLSGQRRSRRRGRPRRRPSGKFERAGGVDQEMKN